MLRHSVAPASPEAISSISSGLSIVGKIVGQGTLQIFGHVEGELHASTVQISDGAQVEGNIVAEELTIGGHVKGTIHADRVKLSSTAVVVGDIYHRSLSIEENGQFEGMSRRQDTVHRDAVARPSARLTGTGHQRQWTGRRRIERPQSIAGVRHAETTEYDTGFHRALWRYRFLGGAGACPWLAKTGDPPS